MAELSQELRRYVGAAREARGLEYKRSLDWSDPVHRAKLVRSMMAMSNLRYGGVIVLGVADDGEPMGLTPQQAAFWTHDLIAPEVSKYAAPYVEFTVAAGFIDDPATWFVVIQINEFAEVPVVCRSDGQGMKAGAIYVRSRRMHETAEVRNEAEMRELVALAVEKGVNQFMHLARSTNAISDAIDAAKKAYEKELDGL